MERVAEPLRMMGATVETTAGCAPVRIQRRESLRGIAYETPVPSAQIKSCVLLAGLYATGDTTVRESRPSRDHTERLLAAMGAELDGDRRQRGHHACGRHRKNWRHSLGDGAWRYLLRHLLAGRGRCWHRGPT